MSRYEQGTGDDGSPGSRGSPMTIKFEVGKSYATRSTCDHDCIYAYVIERRTAESVWIKRNGETVRRAIRVYDDVERIDPAGRYSMSPVISADKTEAKVRGK
jgi:hypothetical protein